MIHTLNKCVCRDEDWWDNDGALNTISMTHPRLPIEHPSRYAVNDSDCQPLQPGIWLVIVLKASFACCSYLKIIVGYKYLHKHL